MTSRDYTEGRQRSALALARTAATPARMCVDQVPSMYRLALRHEYGMTPRVCLPQRRKRLLRAT
jgi:hypothetical protein